MAVFRGHGFILIMFRAVIIENDSGAAQHLAALLEDTWQVQVISSASDGGAGLRLCAELRPDVAFLDIDLPGSNGASLAAEITGLAHPPRLVFIAGNAERAIEAFRLEAVDFLLKPLDPVQVAEAIDRLAKDLRFLRYSSGQDSFNLSRAVFAPKEAGSTDTANELLPVTGVDRDQIRLLARREIVAVLRRARRTWIHTVLEEFATYYPLAQLLHWLRGDPFIQVSRHAVVNLRALRHVGRSGDRVYCLQLHDRLGTEITTSRAGGTRLAAILQTPPWKNCYADDGKHRTGSVTISLLGQKPRQQYKKQPTHPMLVYYSELNERATIEQFSNAIGTKNGNHDSGR
jgi:DNA-binding LytR/AlgR family response regulator